MPIITVATMKGGAGKTTIARTLLGHAAQHGMKAAAYDADLNHSLADWLKHACKVPVTARASVDETELLPAVAELSKAHDLVVVDTPGAASKATMFAVGCADLVLIPCRLSSDDVVEAVKTMKLIESVAQLKGKPIPARVVLVAYKPQARIAQHVLGELAAAKLPVLKARLENLVAFEEMSFSGDVPVTGLAGLQSENLFDEVMKVLRTPESSKRRAA